VKKKNEISERTSVHLDFIRGVAALSVMAGHVRGLFFADFSNVLHQTVIVRILYAVTGFGHQAVVVFFVLSGYFIGTSVCESVDGHSWSWRIYLVNRLTRLELVLFPALILGAVCDHIGLKLPQAASFYYGGLYKYYEPSVALRSTVPAFFGNLLFLQGIRSPVFGSNGPLWSLSYEFWYYILFPLLMLAAASWAGIRRIVYLAFFLILLWFVGTQIRFYFLIWLAGVLVGRVHHMARLRSSGALTLITMVTGLLFFGSLAWNRVHPISPEVLSDSMIGFFFAVWLYALTLGTREDVAPVYAKVAKAISGFSYTLYLIHFPMVLLLRGLLDPQGDWQPGPLRLLYGLGIAIGIFAFAYFLAQITEARTSMVRRSVLRLYAPHFKEVV